jgi:hypothetical protein
MLFKKAGKNIVFNPVQTLQNQSRSKIETYLKKQSIFPRLR